MKASDYIVEYLIKKNIKHIFGYPGGMVTHLMDSLSKYPEQIAAHVTYHEQGAAFAACGYAQASGNVGVAYATSGPGATNLITGICNAYFDSIPVLFITGQVNSFESKMEFHVRQRGFQETDIVSIVKPITKFAGYVACAEKLKWYLDYAFFIAESGRKGPVLLDIPMDIFRAEVDPDTLEGYWPPQLAQGPSKNMDHAYAVKMMQEQLCQAAYPVLLFGQGVKIADAAELARELVSRLHIPVVTTMLAVDVIADKNWNYGFIGAYGDRAANFIVAKSDLVLSFGARLDVRQVGAKRSAFAPNAKIIRIDVDEGELEFKVHDDEIMIQADVKAVLAKWLDSLKNQSDMAHCWSEWNSICRFIRNKLAGMDQAPPNTWMARLSDIIPDHSVITTDVGQNQVWTAQSFTIKENQRVFFSGGHGAMGYSLPAAIGCALATGKTVLSINGDGGIQMNIQELQTIVREQLPVKIVIFNNHALGMIRHFQEMYFHSNYVQTVPSGGYTVPDFEKIASAYGIAYRAVHSDDDLAACMLQEGPEILEIAIDDPTYVFPKLEFGKPNQDQEPLISRELYALLMDTEKILMEIKSTEMEDMGIQ